MKLVLLAIFMNSCMTATVQRDEWLACCKLCDRPQNMDYVVKHVYDEEILCHCLSGKEYRLYEE